MIRKLRDFFSGLHRSLVLLLLLHAYSPNRVTTNIYLSFSPCFFCRVFHEVFVCTLQYPLPVWPLLWSSCYHLLLRRSFRYVSSLTVVMRYTQLLPSQPPSIPLAFYTSWMGISFVSVSCNPPLCECTCV